MYYDDKKTYSSYLRFRPRFFIDVERLFLTL